MAKINIGEGNWADIRAKINTMLTELYNGSGSGSPTYTIGEGNWSTIRTNINSMYQELMAVTVPTTTSAPTTTATATTTVASTTVAPTTTSAPSGNPQNLFLYSEQINNAVWATENITTNEGINGANDLTGNATLELIRGWQDSGSFISQTVTVKGSTEYKLSFDYIRGTWGDACWNAYDLTHNAGIIVVTSYYAQTSGSVQRVVLTFTTTSGTTSISVRPSINTPGIGNCYIGRVQLCETSRYAEGYVKTEATIIPFVALNPQNLLLYSEELDRLSDTPWSSESMTIISTNSANDCDGNATMELCEVGNGRIGQTVTVLANTTYTFSFDARKSTGTVFNYFVWDWNHFSNITNQTSYAGSINVDTPTRISFSFTTPVGCTSIRVDMMSTGGNYAYHRVYLGRVQLCETARYSQGYIVTTSSIIP